jgi:NADP-dependent aldehyde dehydrogenase
MEKFPQIIADAVTARDEYSKWNQSKIIELLELIATNLDAASEELVSLATKETHLTNPRLVGEVGRMSGQWRHMAAVLKNKEYLQVSVDLADPTAQPPKPDLRKSNLPIGIVGIFGASNFPFGFGVGGGDTASAIAAGCPVIIKANPGHPDTSRKIFEIMVDSGQQLNAPKGLFGLLESFDDGIKLVQHEAVSAIAFTGSTTGGRKLHDLAQSRSVPIPFYGELGGLNPIFVTEEANKANAAAIAQGFLDSVSLGAGQFCTKPGFLILINGAEIKQEIVQLISKSAVHEMLNDGIRGLHNSKREEFSGLSFSKLLAKSPITDSDVEPLTIFEISADNLLSNKNISLVEIFGPTAVVVDCKTPQQALEVAKVFDGTLASGVHGQPKDELIQLGIVDLLSRISGRVIMNAWPTGVAVTWSMQHGGPYPASTNSLFTSVGADSIVRFRRPIVYQNFAENLLPEYLQDKNLDLYPRRINGTNHLAAR